MNEAAVDKIVGEMPDFMLRIELREMAQKHLDPKGGWTHFQGLDADGAKFWDTVVRMGFADKGEATPDTGGRPLDVYRLKVTA